MRLGNKVALIIGAGSGIGRATAELFAQEGAKVVVADYDAETPQHTLRSIKQDGVKPSSFRQTFQMPLMQSAWCRPQSRPMAGSIFSTAGVFVKPAPA